MNAQEQAKKLCRDHDDYMVSIGEHCPNCWPIEEAINESEKQARAEVLAACIAGLEKTRAYHEQQASVAQDKGDYVSVGSHERLEYCYAVALIALKQLQPAAQALEALLEEARRQTRDENPNRYLARCPDCGANL